MKIAEVSGGAPATLRVRSTSGPFQPVPAREVEVTLVRSADQTLLKCGANVWSVEGVTPADTTQLIDVGVSGLPVLAYVAQAGADALVIETRRLTQEIRITEAMQLGLDDKVMDDVRRGHRVGGTASDVAAWLTDRLLIPPAPGEPAALRRMVVSGDARGRLDAFAFTGSRSRPTYGGSTTGCGLSASCAAARATARASCC